MTDQSNPKNEQLHDEQLLAYIDGELDSTGRIAFEQLLETDPELRSKLETLQSIEQGLMHLSESTEPISLPFSDEQSTGTSQRKWIGYAAAVLIMASLYLFNPLNSPGTFDAGVSYTKITRSFEPQIVCDTPEKFALYTKEGFGKTINADFNTPIQLVGWRYLKPNYKPEDHSQEPATRILMAQTPEGSRVLAYFVPKGLPKPILEPGSNLHMHPRKISGVRIYEISSLDQPVLLDLLY
jgi:hypothetical protein